MLQVQSTIIRMCVELLFGNLEHNKPYSKFYAYAIAPSVRIHACLTIPLFNIKYQKN